MVTIKKILYCLVFLLITGCYAQAKISQQHVQEKDMYMLSEDEMDDIMPAFQKEFPLWQQLGIKLFVGYLAIREWAVERWQYLKRLARGRMYVKKQRIN